MTEKYTREEFIKLAVKSGYSGIKDAEKYTESHMKDSYSTDDFMKLYHSNENSKFYGSHANGLKHVHGLNGKTTAYNGIKYNSGSSQDWI